MTGGDQAADDRAAVARRGAGAGLAEIRAAMSMLTRIPVRSVSAETTGAGAYGLVGALIGVLAAIPLALLTGPVPTLAAIAAVAALAVLSGALHLDGLADTADALLARDRVAAEAARKDPAIGSGGAVALVLVLAAQVAALAEVATRAGGLVAASALAAAVAASRVLPVLVAWTAAGEGPDLAPGLGPGAGPRGGLGGWFLSRVRGVDVVVSGLTVVAVVIASGLVAGSVVLPLAVAAGMGAGLAAAFGLIHARGQIDGDVLGATVELGLVAILGSLAIAVSVAWPGR